MPWDFPWKNGGFPKVFPYPEGTRPGVQKTMERSTIEKMGKSTISTGSFSLFWHNQRLHSQPQKSELDSPFVLPTSHDIPRPKKRPVSNLCPPSASPWWSRWSVASCTCSPPRLRCRQWEPSPPHLPPSNLEWDTNGLPMGYQYMGNIQNKNNSNDSLVIYIYSHEINNGSENENRWK